MVVEWGVGYEGRSVVDFKDEGLQVLVQHHIYS